RWPRDWSSDVCSSDLSIRVAVASVASDQRISNGAFTLIEAIEHDALYSRQRLFSILFGVFSAMALGLALVGIFSVVAYSVAQRKIGRASCRERVEIVV